MADSAFAHVAMVTVLARPLSGLAATFCASTPPAPQTHAGRSPVPTAASRSPGRRTRPP